MQESSVLSASSSELFTPERRGRFTVLRLTTGQPVSRLRFLIDRRGLELASIGDFERFAAREIDPHQELASRDDRYLVLNENRTPQIVYREGGRTLRLMRTSFNPFVSPSDRILVSAK